MIVIDYNQTFISNYMAETRGRPDVEMNIDLLRHMILNQIRNYKKRFGTVRWLSLAIIAITGAGMFILITRHLVRSLESPAVMTGHLSLTHYIRSAVSWMSISPIL